MFRLHSCSIKPVWIWLSESGQVPVNGLSQMKTGTRPFEIDSFLTEISFDRIHVNILH